MSRDAKTGKWDPVRLLEQSRKEKILKFQNKGSIAGQKRMDLRNNVQIKLISLFGSYLTWDKAEGSVLALEIG